MPTIHDSTLADLERQAARLRDELVRRVLEAPPAPAVPGADDDRDALLSTTELGLRAVETALLELGEADLALAFTDARAALVRARQRLAVRALARGAAA